MENVGFQPSGEEIERALMDLGPLLGVTIKEEAPDELAEPGAQPPAALNVASISDGVVAGGSGEGTSKGSGDGGADSLASPSAARPPLAASRCVMCQAPLALTEGTPKLMECLHSACEPCIKSKIEEKQANARDFLGAERITIVCPACRLQCQPANMIDQRFVLEKVAIEQAGSNGVGRGEQQCNSCEEPEPATSYCADCAEFICDNCVHAHQRLKITKDHTIKSKEEAVAELQAAQSQAPSGNEMFCRAHPLERLALFCETCDRLTCRDCQLHHHRDHKYQFSTEMAAQARANISSLLSEVSYKRVLLGSAMKVIRDRQQLIADKKKALVHEITQTVVKLTNAINTRGKQLVLRLNEVCDGKQRTLSEKKEALEQLAGVTSHCVEFVSGALAQGSDTAVLHAKRLVCAHLQRVKSRRADIPNPEIPVRISLALDALPDLLRVLSSIGAIVVDGKVDGGAGGSGGGAQGPYHPPGAGAGSGPGAATPPAPAPAPPSSAVMALQHVAMHQSYVQAVSSAGGGGGGAGVGVGAGMGAGAGAAYLPLQHQLRARAHTPLRHPHVTSTTHPHHLHVYAGVSELNLRGLLNAQAQPQPPPGRGRGALPQHSAQAAMHHAYHQMIGAYANSAYGASSGGGGGGAASAGGRRSGGPRTPSPAPPAYPHLPHHPHLPHQPHHATTSAAASSASASAAKWHIPQHALSNGGMEASGSGGGCSGGADFKITLGRQHPPHAHAAAASSHAHAHPASPHAHAHARAGPSGSVVTSTNPKTPSPSLNGVASSELDKVCAESVQDLMATIAKLDSNGVQVVAEQPSTARSAASSPSGSGSGSGSSAGSELAPAPVPSPAPHVHSSTDGDKAAGATSGDPNEDWCAVCMDGGELMCCDKCPKVFHQYCHIPTIEKLPDETETWQCLLCVNFAEVSLDEEAPAGGGLSPRLQKIVERITLELYCQYEPSLAFREPVSLENAHYHAKISRPMCLDAIRMKLQPRAALRYSHPAHFVADCRLLFRNAYAYNPPESQIYKDAKRLEEFFDAQLVKWLPEFAYWSGDGDPPTKRPRLE